MSLLLPTIGQEQAPTWAEDQQSSMLLLDQHNHASGNGVQIEPSGLNITSDLPFLSNNAIDLRSVRFTPQGSPLAEVTDLDCCYVSGVDLYYNDGIGNQVRITQSGGVAGTPGSIAGLASPASATYVAATPAFVFQSDADTPANLDGGSLTIRNITANSKGITILPPNALAADYSVTFPAALPAGQRFMTLDNSGNIAAAWNVDNSTLEVNSNAVRVKDLGITDAKIANATITGGKIASSTISGSNLVDNINLPVTGTAGWAQVNSLNILTGVSNATTNSAKPVKVLLAQFDANGFLTATGPNFGFNDNSRQSTGVFDCTFASALTSGEVAQGFVTVLGDGSAGYTAVIEQQDNTHLRVVIRNSSTQVNTNLNFNIMAFVQ